MPPVARRRVWTTPDLALQGTRERVYAWVADHPGTSFMEVLQAVTRYVGATAYHLHVLERAGLVRSARTGRRRRYWVTGQATDPQQVANAWAQQPHVPTLLALARRGTVCTEAGPAIGRTRQTATWHLQRLARAGILTEERDGRWRVFRLKEADA